MNKKRENKSGLRLIKGNIHCEIFLGSVLIVAAPEDSRPFPVDAVAYEEDTFLVLSTDTRVRESEEHIVRLMTRVIEARPAELGKVLVKGKRPFKLLAIVHDLDQNPTWKEEWIESALEGIFREAESRELRSVALPLIGTLHGSLKKRRFIELLKMVLVRLKPCYLERLWLIAPVESNREIIELLKQANNSMQM